jgi:metal-responsive CopG/Arc/MetJ family transcriptional regulator
MSTIHRDGKPIEGDGSDKTHAAFSVRIPIELLDQIDARRKVSKRSRNKEIEMLLERQIEAEVERDQLMIDKIAKMNLTPP